MSTSPGTKLLTAEEVAARWQLEGKRPAAGVYRMTRDGVIPKGAVVKLGSRYRYRLEGLEAFEAGGGKGLDE